LDTAALITNLLGVTKHRRETSDESDGVDKLTDIDALTDLVSILLVTSTDTEHRRVSKAALNDPLLGGRDLQIAIGDDKADTISGEDPAGHARLLRNVKSRGLDDMRSNDSLVVSDGSADARMLLGGDPGVVDLVVFESEALPGGVAVERSTDVDDEALLTELLDGIEAVDVSKASSGGLTDGHTTIETEGELLRDSAVAGSVDLGPGGSAGTVLEERMIKEANALLIAISSLSDDEGGSLKRVAALPRHGAMARLADDLNLNLHTTTLATIDTKRTHLLTAITSTLGVDNGIREHLSRDVTLEDVTADVHGCTTIVILLSDSAVRADDAATEGAEGLELEHDLGGDDLRDDTSELIGRATAEDEVLPLVTRREVAELLAHLLLVDLGGVGQTVVAVDALTDALVPGSAEGVDSVGVAIEVEDLLLGGGDAILAVHDNPDKVAHGVEVDILSALDGLDLNDALLQVLQAGELVVAHAALGVLVAVVGGDSDGLAEELGGERAVLLSKFCNTFVKRHLWLNFH